MKYLAITLLILGTITLSQAASCSGVQAWRSGCITYCAGDLVTYNGVLYENCGCQGEPGNSNNQCWLSHGACSVQNTCETAVNWSSVANYQANSIVRWAGRLFKAYCDNKGQKPQTSTSVWESIASCDVCEQIYNSNYYYQGGWNAVQGSQKKIYRARWWVGPQCAPGTNSVWVLSGQCGCTDSTAFNYNSNATNDDGTCVPKILGCTDPTMFNYNPQANVDDGNCIPVIVGCMTPGMFNYNANANTAGECIPVIVGCMTPGMFNYNANANTAGQCIPVIVGCMTPGMFNYNANANTAGACIPVIVGCQDPAATNYNASANTAGSCTYAVVGCTDPNATNYNPLATVANNDCCEYPAPIEGCTDPTASNYNPNATVSNNACCEYNNKVLGCTDPTAINYDPAANTDNGCCEYKQDVYGCTNPEADNYNPQANISVDCCTFSVNRPNQGCNSPAWSATAQYTAYQVVTYGGRAWRLKNWGTITGSSNRPDLNVWGAWELYLQCDAVQDCCTSTTVYGGSKSFWVGDCVIQTWNNVSHRFRAQKNTSGNEPRWNCGPTNTWSSEIICP